MSSDWIETFLELTETVRSPYIFRLWAAITVISAVLERRCWTETDVAPLCPNQFVILAGNPASGKGNALREARKMLGSLSGIGEVYLGPDNPSSASFMDELVKAEKVAPQGMGVPTYSAMTVLSRELSSFMSKYETQFAANLSDLYDNPPTFISPRRQSTSVSLSAPTLNIAAAATPDTLLDTIPENAWGQGLTSRIIFVYGVAPDSYRDPFNKRKDMDISVLTRPLKTFFYEIQGEFIWESEAQDAFRYWINELKCAPVPDYGRLVNYIGRRTEHLMKLAMVSAVSAGNGICVTLKDFRRAQKWLFDTEEVMPDVFRAMTRQTDAQILQDLHYWMYITHGNSGDPQKGLSEQQLWLFLEDKVPHEKIPTIMKTMETTGRMYKSGFTGRWFPNPMNFRNEKKDPKP